MHNSKTQYLKGINTVNLGNKYSLTIKWWGGERLKKTKRNPVQYQCTDLEIYIKENCIEHCFHVQSFLIRFALIYLK